MIIQNYIEKKKNKYFNNRLFRSFNKVFSEISKDVSNPKKTLNVLSKNFNFSFKKKDLVRFKKYKTIAIIGMGGSILGAEAIYNFLELKIKKKIYFFDDLDTKKIARFKKMENVDQVLIFIISKSGNTIETISNSFALNIIKKNSKNIIIITEKRNNLLFNLSKKLNLQLIEHNPFLGGRYSVMSEVGLIPAYLMGLDVSKLRSKTTVYLKGKKKLFLKKSTTIITNLLMYSNIKNLIFLNYSPELEKFLFWCQQLIAESLGKKGNGFLPMISNVPKDHHSLLQLYLDGPRDKIFYIFNSNEKEKKIIKINKIANIKSYLEKKSLSEVKIAQKNALIKSLKLNKIPFREFKINKINEETLSELFSYFILETVIIGKMLKINPFDQPAVEQIKTFTKKLLN